MILRALALTGIVWSAVGIAAPGPRAPTGKWVVEYAESQCYLSREYGTSAEPLTLVLQPTIMGDKLLVIVLKPGRSEKISKHPVVIETQPGTTIHSELGAYQLRRTGLMRYLIALDNSQSSQVKTANIISVQAKNLVDESFTLPGLRPALRALDDCRIDLLVGWGMPREIQARLKTPAQPVEETFKWFSPSDYPMAAMRSGSEGRVRARIRVGANGRVAGCDIVSSSGSKELDVETCRSARKHGRYAPAQDVDGRPMESFDVLEVSWSLG